MISPPEDQSGQDDLKRREEEFSRTVSRKARRRMRALKEGRRGAWLGLGLYGVVGWSIVVPALIGVAIGLFLDSAWPGRPSWTLILLVLGLAMGITNAWRWINQERVRGGPEETDDH